MLLAHPNTVASPGLSRPETRPPQTPTRTEEETLMADRQWRDHAACAGHPPQWWDNDTNTPTTALQAQHICASCPVLLECDAHATRKERHGIWAGRNRNPGDIDHLLDSPTRPTRPSCGTRRGIQAHHDACEPLCVDCKIFAHTAYETRYAGTLARLRANKAQ
jgi:hypothetical protein